MCPAPGGSPACHDRLPSATSDPNADANAVRQPDRHRDRAPDADCYADTYQ
ncbi:MAG: hypothetical protein HY690_07725, partial [Chloroflexi bacterium]|nr:hypothetical protein [Chloroflexota bacterium]